MSDTILKHGVGELFRSVKAVTTKLGFERSGQLFRLVLAGVPACRPRPTHTTLACHGLCLTLPPHIMLQWCNAQAHVCVCVQVGC